MAQPTDQCPHQYGFFPITGEDCSKYLNCQRGIATVMNCPNGLVFNEQLSSCDWPENVPLCDSDGKPTYILSLVTPITTGDEDNQIR